ncbi:MAG: hypothetical protein ACRDDY_10400 [Clostridium sp.]|uniref:hypothetical protein n=1 Tax=Clostridium sp. TaxID=1506 RepID=UPI003EE7CAE2
MAFEISVEEAMKIRGAIGSSAEKKVFGVENTKLMRALITEEVKKKYGIEKRDIVYEYYTRMPGEAYWFWKATVYYEIIITKNKVLMIGFDADVNITIEKYLELKEIEAAGLVIKEGEKSIIGRDAFVIQLVDGTRFYIDYKDNDMRNETKELMNNISRLGVKDIKSEAKKNNRAVILFYIITIAIGIGLVYSFL